MKFIKHVRAAMKPMPVEERLKYLTPEQRAKYDENMRRVEDGRAQSQAAWQENKLREAEVRVLGGPAGEYMYGAGMDDFGTPDEIERLFAEKGVLAATAELRAKRKGEFKNAVKQSFNVSPVPQISDPAQRTFVSGRSARRGTLRWRPTSRRLRRRCGSTGSRHAGRPSSRRCSRTGSRPSGRSACTGSPTGSAVR